MSGSSAPILSATEGSLSHPMDDESKQMHANSFYVKVSNNQFLKDSLPVIEHAGSSGEGLPYAPENWPSPGDVWTWRVGKRDTLAGFWQDRSVHPPDRLRSSTGNKLTFNSRVSLEQYIRDIFPDADVDAFFASFIWKIPCTNNASKEIANAYASRKIIKCSEAALAVRPGDCKASNVMCSIKAKTSLSWTPATCYICCTEPNFCQYCCCILCSRTIDLIYEGYNFIECKAPVYENFICGHVAHIECALRAYMAGKVEGSVDLDAQYYCRCCDNKTDLLLHVDKIVKVCESIDKRDDKAKVLNLGLRILRGSEKMKAKKLHHHIAMLMEEFKHGVSLDEICEKKSEISEPAQDSTMSTKALAAAREGKKKRKQQQKEEVERKRVEQQARVQEIRQKHGSDSKRKSVDLDQELRIATVQRLKTGELPPNPRKDHHKSSPSRGPKTSQVETRTSIPPKSTSNRVRLQSTVIAPEASESQEFKEMSLESSKESSTTDTSSLAVANIPTPSPLAAALITPASSAPLTSSVTSKGAELPGSSSADMMKKKAGTPAYDALHAAVQYALSTQDYVTSSWHNYCMMEKKYKIAKVRIGEDGVKISDYREELRAVKEELALQKEKNDQLSKAITSQCDLVTVAEKKAADAEQQMAEMKKAQESWELEKKAVMEEKERLAIEAAASTKEISELKKSLEDKERENASLRGESSSLAEENQRLGKELAEQDSMIEKASDALDTVLFNTWKAKGLKWSSDYDEWMLMIKRRSDWEAQLEAMELGREFNEEFHLINTFNAEEQEAIKRTLLAEEINAAWSSSLEASPTSRAMAVEGEEMETEIIEAEEINSPVKEILVLTSIFGAEDEANASPEPTGETDTRTEPAPVTTSTPIDATTQTQILSSKASAGGVGQTDLSSVQMSIVPGSTPADDLERALGSASRELISPLRDPFFTAEQTVAIKKEQAEKIGKDKQDQQ